MICFLSIVDNKRWRISKGQLKMDNPEKLATKGIQDEEKQSKNTTQYSDFNSATTKHKYFLIFKVIKMIKSKKINIFFTG